MAARRALITGITGMVGSHLAEFLLEQTDWDVIGMCRWRSPLDNLANIAWRINAGRPHLTALRRPARHHVDPEGRGQGASPDYVFHLAAQSFPRTSFDAPLDTMDTNVQGTVRVLDALKQHAPKAVIHVCASSEVFGRVPEEKLPIDEECTFHPASPYAISKVGTDLVGRFYAEAYGMTVMTTRMFTHTGPRRGDVFAESTFAKQIAMIEHNLHPAGRQGRQPAIAAHRRRRARCGARLLHAGHRQPDRRRLLQYRRHPLLHRRRDPRHAARASRRARTTSGSRSIPTACVRSMPTCRCRTPRSSKPIPAGSPRSPTSRRCATCWTTGGTAWQRKATVF